MGEKTSIEVSLETWQDLNQRKRRPGESFDDVIQRLLGDRPDSDRRIAEEPRDEPDTRADALTPEDVAAHVGDAVGLTNQRERSLAAALRYLRDEGEAQTSEIVAAAYAAVPTYASEASWRSNLWNSVGTALRKTGAVELTNKSRGRWRWVGE
jgi:predicted CopG family antitoxin